MTTTQARTASQPAFRALSDPTRRAIIELVADRPRTVGEIAGKFAMSRPAVAKHLKILRDSDIIVVAQNGRERINTLNPAGLKPASDWLDYFDRYWDERLDALKTAVEKKR